MSAIYHQNMITEKELVDRIALLESENKRLKESNNGLKASVDWTIDYISSITKMPTDMYHLNHIREILIKNHS